jgi:hypothetical protein
LIPVVAIPGESFQSRALGVGHPVESLSDVRCADAVCAQYSRPDCVAIRFQVCRYSIEPVEANRLRNLLPKHSLRTELGDKPVKDGPEVAIIASAFALSGCGERLAGTASCPNRSSCGPSGEFEGKTPASDPGEEVTLDVSGEFMRFYFGYASFVHIPRRNQPRSHQLPQPRRRLWIVLVVVVHSFVLPHSGF